MNPGGSVKDRAAWGLVNWAEQTGAFGRRGLRKGVELMRAGRQDPAGRNDCGGNGWEHGSRTGARLPRTRVQLRYLHARREFGVGGC